VRNLPTFNGKVISDVVALEVTIKYNYSMPYFVPCYVNQMFLQSKSRD